MQKMDLEKLESPLGKRWRAWATQSYYTNPNKYLNFHVLLEEEHGIKIIEGTGYYKTWKDKTYEITDEQKYVEFILKWT